MAVIASVGPDVMEPGASILAEPLSTAFPSMLAGNQIKSRETGINNSTGIRDISVTVEA